MDYQGRAISLADLIQIRLLAKQHRLLNRKRSTALHSGNNVSAFRGRGLDFDEIRAYMPGDDIRHMDWRVLAKTGVPHTKLYQEEHERPVFFVVDYNPSMFFGSRVAFKSVAAAKTAAFFAWSALQAGDKVGGIVFSGEKYIECQPRSGKQGVLTFLKALADKPEPLDKNNVQDSLTNTLRRLRSVCKPGSLIFLISDFWRADESTSQQLLSLKKHNDIKACVIKDPLEITSPPPGIYTVGDESDVLTFNTHSKKIRENYQAIFARSQEFIETMFKRCGVQYFQKLTSDDVVLSQARHSAT